MVKSWTFFTPSYFLKKKYLLIAMPLSLHFPQNVDSVIISQSTRHLVVIHWQVIFLNAPKFGQSGRINNLEHTRILILPSNVRSISLLRVVEQLLQEVPQQPAVGVQLGGLPVWGGRGLRRGCRRRPGGSSLRRRCGWRLVDFRRVFGVWMRWGRGLRPSA